MMKYSVISQTYFMECENSTSKAWRSLHDAYIHKHTKRITTRVEIIVDKKSTKTSWSSA